MKLKNKNLQENQMGTLKIFAYWWGYEDTPTDGLVISCYGLNENNKSVLLRIIGFKPYIYVELGLDRWTQPILKNISQKWKEKYHSIDTIKFVKKKRLYYNHRTNTDGEWHDTLFPFLYVSFDKKNAIYGFEKELRYNYFVDCIQKKVKAKVHENNASPILQFVCQQDLPTASWIEFKGKLVPTDARVSKCDFEYVCASTNVHRVKDYNVVPNACVMAFDIEVNSTNPDKMPNAKLSGDKIFQISCCIGRVGDAEPATNILVTLGKVNRDLLDPKLIVYECEFEPDVLLAFTDIINKYNPQVITGYNIFSFDIPYMIERSKSNNVFYNFTIQGYTGDCAVEKEIKWSSTAYKNQNFKYLDAHGRLYVDMLPIIQRDYKLDNYKLKTVSDLFIGETKDPLTAKDIFKCYKIGTTVGKTPNEEQRAKNAISIVGKYCVQDSALVFKLFNNLQTWVGLVEMATTCNVPIFTLYTQGQQIKVFSQIYKECLAKNYVVEKDGYIARDDEKLTGAIVLDPIPGIYDKITPFDFTSLYPTTIIAYNLCFSTLVKDTDPVDDRYCHVIHINEHKNCIAEGSMVSLYNSSVSIESLYNHRTVLTFNSTLDYQPMSGWYNQDKQQCIRLEFDNGSHLVCTPDHKIMSRDRGWINAGELDVKEKIQCGIMYPQVTCDSSTFDFHIDDDLSFRTQTRVETAKFLAYTRLLGYLNLDARQYQYIAKTRNLVDAKGLIQDVFLATNKQVEYLYDGTYYSVHIPLKFHKNILHNYMTNGIPVYLLHERCPKAFITEFLGGLFGQSYLFPEYHKRYITGISITSNNNLQWIKHTLKKLYEIDSYIDGSCLCVAKQSIFTFYNEISYRYNTLKQYRLQLIVNYTRYKQQKSKLVFWKRHTFKNYLKDAGVSDLFTKLNLDIFPSYNTTLVKSSFDGVHKVYDITVPTTSSFVCNSIIVHNCDHDTEKKDKKDKNVTCQDYKYRFLKEPKGIVPTLLEDLLSARKQTRGQQKKIKQQMESSESPEKKAELQLLYNVLEKRQLAYKVSANSVYGAYGTRRGYLPFLPGAQCTTALGRMNILKAGKYIQEHYKAKLVYGDTDSVYVNFPVQSEGSFETLWDFCEQVESEINSLFIKPMYLSFESAIYDRFFILTKKRYVCLKADRHGKISDKLMIRGVLLTRRDNAPMIRDIYKQTIMSIFYKEDPVKIVDTILEHIQKMFTRQHDLNVYIITKSIGEIADYKVRPLSEDEKTRMKRLKDLKCTEQEYTSRALPANIQLAEKMRRRGKLVSASQRIEYVITNPKHHLAKQFDKIEDVEYVREHSDVIQIDPLYYLKLMSKSMDEVLFVGLKLNEMVTRQYKYRLLKHKLIQELNEYFGNNYRVIGV